MKARPWLARTEHDFALMLLQRGEPDDSTRAAELLSSAETSSRELGLNALGAEIAQLRVSR
jgi:hypothetical protein